MKQLLLGLFVLSISITMTPQLQAEEARCTELGADCYCSEPLNTTSYTSIATGYYNPGDSTVKQCAVDGLATGGVRRAAAQAPVGSNDATVFAALPSGHSLSYVLKGASGHTADWIVGGRFASAPTQRRAIRGYVYHSSDWQLATDASCTNNGKTMELGSQGAILTNGGGNSWGMYSWGPAYPTADRFWKANPVVNAVTHSGNPDCCSSGPGAGTGAQAALTFTNLRGKWVRYEFVVINASGTPGFVAKVYVKNVTDNGPEYTLIDTSIACTGCGARDWIAPDFTENLEPPAYYGPALDDFWMNLYRAGTCGGYRAVSHVMTAAWSTNDGQRIGAATEIEGSSTPTRRFAPSINLRRAEVPNFVELRDEDYALRVSQ